MRRIKALALVSMFALSACGGPLSLLTGGGPKVAANVQAGKTNNQTLGVSENVEQTITRPQARTIEQSTGPVGTKAENIGVVNTTTNTMNPYVLAVLMLFAGFVIPSPSEIARTVRSWFTRTKKEPTNG